MVTRRGGSILVQNRFLVTVVDCELYELQLWHVWRSSMLVENE